MFRILGPLAAEDPRIDDVGMTFWAASGLALCFLKGGAPDRAVSYAEAAVDLVREAALRVPKSPSTSGGVRAEWRVSPRAQAAAGDHAAAMASLGASIEILRALDQALSTAGRRRDLREAVESALKVSEPWAAASSTERQRWVELSNTLA